MQTNLLAREASLPVQLIDVNRLQDGNPNMPQDAEIADHGGMFVDGTVDDNGGVLEFPTQVPQRTPSWPSEINEDDVLHEIDQIGSVHSLDSKGMEFVVEGLVALGAVTLICGEAGCGKTTLVTALADHVSRGQPFAGRKCIARPVLILDRENPLVVVQERLRRLRIFDDGAALKIWGSWRQGEVPGAPLLRKLVALCNPKPLVIFDSFIAFFKGDENDASAVRAFFQPMRDLANLGATVIAIHHFGKNGECRGSSDIPASVDTGFGLTNSGGMSLRQLKMKPFKVRFTVDSEAIFNYADGSFTSDGCADSTGNGCAPVSNDPTKEESLAMSLSISSTNVSSAANRRVSFSKTRGGRGSVPPGVRSEHRNQNDRADDEDDVTIF